MHKDYELWDVTCDGPVCVWRLLMREKLSNLFLKQERNFLMLSKNRLRKFCKAKKALIWWRSSNFSLWNCQGDMWSRPWKDKSNYVVKYCVTYLLQYELFKIKKGESIQEMPTRSPPSPMSFIALVKWRRTTSWSERFSVFCQLLGKANSITLLKLKTFKF